MFEVLRHYLQTHSLALQGIEPLADKLPNRYPRPPSSPLQHLTAILYTPLFSGTCNCCLNNLQGRLVRDHGNLLVMMYSSLV